MAGEDLTSAELAAPPRPPLENLHPDELGAMADAASEATWKLGLRSWFWGEGVCLLGLLRDAEVRRQVPPKAVLDFLVAQPPVLEHVNNLAPAAAAARAAATTDRADLHTIVEHCLAWFDGPGSLTRAPNGAIEHWPGGVWADTVFMAGSFLLHAGRLLDRDDLVTEAVRQWIAHAEVLQHPGNGLFAHGSHHGETVWSFWGRANAWIALAGVELVELEASRPGVDEIRDRLRLQLHSLTERQPEHGVWDVLVDGQPENRGILETSAAAGIGAAMLRTSACVPDDAVLRNAGSLAIRGALAYLDAGMLTRVSAGTVLQLVPFGYSVIRDDRPQLWGQGLALHALAAALDLGLEA